MAQGKTKLASKASSGGRANNGQMKKGKRVIPPKARAEINHKIMQKNLSAKINNSIEKQMISAASSGKLTVLKNTAGDTRPESCVPRLFFFP
ncbi:hypothetical protein DL93DRAFT_2054418 [Clavulina sp. PMI_390]|nr:hypothetical protein DL93DRAFT_2054418 [Clavulina sp. PMI_390]